MAVEITIPRLGWSMEEGTFREWLKAAGDLVRPGEIVFALEGDKAVHEVESLDSGTLYIPADAPAPGDIVRVGQVIGFLLAAGESPPVAMASRPVQSAAPTGAIARQVVRAVAPTPSEAVATPRARRRARELNVDWSVITGSGRNGRIRERDVVAFASRKPNDATPSVSGRQEPASRIRQSIAQRMLAGVHQTAPVTLTTKVDATEFVECRNRWKAAAQSIVPSYTDMLVQLVATLLPECPHLNACWRDEGIFVYDAINIAMAIDTERGLVAPVIHDVSRLSLAQISEQSQRLIEQARAGKLSERQLQGGTFTVTNLGMFDIDCFTPIINLPQTAILGIGRIVREPVVRGDKIVIGWTMSLSLTFDHRVIDGAPAARWLQRLSQIIRQPGHWLSQTEQRSST